MNTPSTLRGPSDDVVEKRLLSNTFFTLPLAFLDSWTYRTARRVFVELLTSAEAYFLTESVLIKFSSLQLLISAKNLAQKWGRCITVYFPIVIEIWVIFRDL